MKTTQPNTTQNTSRNNKKPLHNTKRLSLHCAWVQTDTLPTVSLSPSLSQVQCLTVQVHVLSTSKKQFQVIVIRLILVDSLTNRNDRNSVLKTKKTNAEHNSNLSVDFDTVFNTFDLKRSQKKLWTWGTHTNHSSRIQQRFVSWWLFAFVFYTLFLFCYLFQSTTELVTILSFDLFVWWITSEECWECKPHTFQFILYHFSVDMITLWQFSNLLVTNNQKNPFSGKRYNTFSGNILILSFSLSFSLSF